MVFWIVAVLMALGALVPVLAALARAGSADAAARDLAIYRDQLSEVERDLARGTVTEAEAERLRTEVKRRLLEADRARTGPAGRAPRPALIGGGVLVVAVVLIGGWVYWTVGAPGYPDLPLAVRLADAEATRAERLSQSEAEIRAGAALPSPVAPDPEFAEIMDRLRARVAEAPDDPQGLRFLAQYEARLGNFVDARAAQERLLDVLGEDATAGDYTALGVTMVLAAGGYVTPEAEAAFDAALARDPRNAEAAYYKGLTQAQTGRPDIAFRIWRGLLENAPIGPDLEATLRRQMPGVAERAGIRYDMPPPRSPVAGPDADDMAAAAEMDPEARAEMIRGMVERLSERLATEGGTAPDWARLIRALGVLGETRRAAAIWDEAQQVFANQPQALAAVSAAADEAGLTE